MILILPLSLAPWGPFFSPWNGGAPFFFDRRWRRWRLEHSISWRRQSTKPRRWMLELWMLWSITRCASAFFFLTLNSFCWRTNCETAPGPLPLAQALITAKFAGLSMPTKKFDPQKDGEQLGSNRLPKCLLQDAKKPDFLARNPTGKASWKRNRLGFGHKCIEMQDSPTLTSRCEKIETSTPLKTSRSLTLRRRKDAFLHPMLWRGFGCQEPEG